MAGTVPTRPTTVPHTYDMWSILLANKALVQYHDAVGDAGVLTAVTRNLREVLDVLDRTPLFRWGAFRWFEGLVSVYYVYQCTGEPWLLELAQALRAGIRLSGVLRVR